MALRCCPQKSFESEGMSEANQSARRRMGQVAIAKVFTQGPSLPENPFRRSCRLTSDLRLVAVLLIVVLLVVVLLTMLIRPLLMALLVLRFVALRMTRLLQSYSPIATRCCDNYDRGIHDTTNASIRVIPCNFMGNATAFIGVDGCRLNLF